MADGVAEGVGIVGAFALTVIDLRVFCQFLFTVLVFWMWDLRHIPVVIFNRYLWFIWS